MRQLPHRALGLHKSTKSLVTGNSVNNISLQEIGRLLPGEIKQRLGIVTHALCILLSLPQINPLDGRNSSNDPAEEDGEEDGKKMVWTTVGGVGPVGARGKVAEPPTQTSYQEFYSGCLPFCSDLFS